jgi:arylsulfatase A-like enzyme
MNVLLLVVDALRSDYLGCYGNGEVKTTEVDTLAREGVKFDQAISTATWTPPSTSAIISGIFPHKLGIYDFDTVFNPQIKTIFHYFLENDYEIGSYVFDEKYLFSKFDFACVQGNFMDYTKPLNWIKKNKHKDFFLYLHYYWVHGPYEPQNSAEAWSKSNQKLLAMLREDPEGVEKCKTLYKKAVEVMSEEWLAQILNTLKEEDILDDTLIVLTSDHGESWGERIKDKSTIRVNFDLHGRFLYDELLKIPLIFRMPKYLPAGITVKRQVRNIDIMPTIIDIAGISQSQITDGVSLKSMIFKEMDGKKDDKMDKNRGLQAVSSAPDVEGKTIMRQIAKISLRTLQWKLIWSLKESFEELYHLRDDPGETVNVAAEYTDVHRALKALLEEELKKAPPEHIPRKEEQKIKDKIRELRTHQKI